MVGFFNTNLIKYKRNQSSVPHFRLVSKDYHMLNIFIAKFCKTFNNTLEVTTQVKMCLHSPYRIWRMSRMFRLFGNIIHKQL